jgi:uncharacterized protein
MLFYLVFAIVPLVAGLAAQGWVNRTFAAASRIPSTSGLTGAQVSRRLLDSAGLANVGIERIGGRLSDHYDPREKVMRLSEPVGGSSSVAAIAVAAHETGHAFQDAGRDTAFELRSAIVPGVGFASSVWMLPFLLGIFTGSLGLVWISVALFAAIVIFHVVTLPVEFGASRRALAILTQQGILTSAEVPVARKVLTAAALTYVVGALAAVAQLVYLLGVVRD